MSKYYDVGAYINYDPATGTEDGWRVRWLDDSDYVTAGATVREALAKLAKRMHVSVSDLHVTQLKYWR